MPWWPFEAHAADAHTKQHTDISRRSSTYNNGQEPIYLFIISGPPSDVDRALSTLPGGASLGRYNSMEPSDPNAQKQSTAFVFVRTERPSALVVSLKGSARMNIEVVTDLRLDRRPRSLDDGFEPMDFIYEEPKTLVSDLMHISSMRYADLSQVFSGPERLTLLKRLHKYLIVLDKIVRAAHVMIDSELGPQKLVNRHGYRHIPDHDLAHLFIRPCRGLARDIFSITDQFSGMDSGQFIYTNARKADLAGFSVLVGRRLDELLKKDLFIRESAIVSLARESRSETLIHLPRVQRTVALVSGPSSKAVSGHIPDPVYALGFEQVEHYSEQVKGFIEKAINLSKGLETSSDRFTASEVLQSFLSDLIDGENFVLPQSRAFRDTSDFQLRRYYTNVAALFNAVLAKVSELGSSSDGSYWILLEHAQALLERADAFAKGKDPRTLSSRYRAQLGRLNKITHRLVKAAHCEAAISGQ